MCQNTINLGAMERVVRQLACLTKRLDSHATQFVVKILCRWMRYIVSDTATLRAISNLKLTAGNTCQADSTILRAILFHLDYPNSDQRWQHKTYRTVAEWYWYVALTGMWWTGLKISAPVKPVLSVHTMTYLPTVRLRILCTHHRVAFQFAVSKNQYLCRHDLWLHV